MFDFGIFLELMLFGSMAWAISILSVFIIILFATDWYENGYWATVATVGLFTLFFFWGKESFDTHFLPMFTWSFVFWYFTLGLIHSFLRTFFYARKKLRKLKDDEYSFDDKDRRKRRIEEIRSNLKGNVFRWWFLWPISLLLWFLKDFIHEVYLFCWDKLKRLYNKIFDWGLKSTGINIDDEVDDEKITIKKD